MKFTDGVEFVEINMYENLQDDVRNIVKRFFKDDPHVGFSKYGFAVTDSIDYCIMKAEGCTWTPAAGVYINVAISEFMRLSVLSRLELEREGFTFPFDGGPGGGGPGTPGGASACEKDPEEKRESISQDEHESILKRLHELEQEMVPAKSEPKKQEPAKNEPVRM